MAQVHAGAHRFRPSTPPTLNSLHPPIPILSATNAPTLPPTNPSQTIPPSSYKSGHLNLDAFSPVNQNGSFEFDRVLKSGQVHRRVKKKGAWKPSWKPSFLVLRPNLLSIYKDAGETGLQASITLSDVTAVAKVKKTNTNHVFGVFSPAKNYHFQGLSERDTTDWIEFIGTEARVNMQEDLSLPSPSFPSEHQDSQPYESTDPSGDDEIQSTGSPETTQWDVRGQKARSRASTVQRRTSHLNEYSGNEMMTSHSDFSDALPGSLPKSSGGLSSNPKPWNLTPVVSGQNLRPQMARNFSQMSGIDTTAAPNDPERVIRQGWLNVLKTKGGVKQWKTLWVVLRPKNLSFYKNEQEYSAVKLVPMRSVINAAEIDPISKTKQFCFQVIVDDKTFRLCALDEETLDKWLGALKSVLARRQEADRVKREKQMMMDGMAAVTVK